MNRSALALRTLLSRAEKSLPSSSKDSSTTIWYFPGCALTKSWTPVRKSLPWEVFSQTRATRAGLWSFPALCSWSIQPISVVARFSTGASVPKIHL